MIPANHWHDNDDGTAWLVTHECNGDHQRNVGCHKTYRDLDRPCGECGGDGDRWFRLGGSPCPACIDGRHTFEIEVAWQTEVDAYESQTYRVSIVPGMVLPIHDWCPDEKPANHICHAWQGGQQSDQWWHHRDFNRDDWTERQITLPPAAAPGMWAVKVRTVSSETADDADHLDPFYGNS